MVDLHHLLNERGLGVAPRVGREQAGRVGEQDEELRAHEMGDQGGQAVVVAEADLLVGHGVVLVDDRDHAQVRQVAQRPPRVQVLRAVHEVERCQQHLTGQDAVRLEAVLPHPHQAVLAHGGDGLEHRGIRGPLRAAVERVPPGRDGAGRDDDHGVPVGARRGQVPAQTGHRLGRHR